MILLLLSIGLGIGWYFWGAHMRSYYAQFGKKLPLENEMDQVEYLIAENKRLEGELRASAARIAELLEVVNETEDGASVWRDKANRLAADLHRSNANVNEQQPDRWAALTRLAVEQNTLAIEHRETVSTPYRWTIGHGPKLLGSGPTLDAALDDTIARDASE